MASSPLSSSSSTSSFPSSSPTTSSFYQPPSHRSHQSRTSTRRSSKAPNWSPSSSNSLRAQLLEQTLSARQSARGKARAIPDIPWGEAGESLAPGAMKGGMWEENTAEEELQIGKKLMWEMKRKKEEADEWDGVMLPEDEEDQALYPHQEEEEPPDDVFEEFTSYSSYSPPPLNTPLASSPSATAGDGEYEEMDLDTTLSFDRLTIKQAALQNPCSCCSGSLREVEGGVTCLSCSWDMATSTMNALQHLFEEHMVPTAFEHRPTVWWSEHTGTLILCRACDESFAA